MRTTKAPMTPWATIAYLCASLLLASPKHAVANDIMMSVLLKSPGHEVATEIYARYGSPAPNAMASAISSTSTPHLSMAQSIVESAGNPSAIGSSGEQGGWQVIADYWWPVPNKPRDQAVQAQTILALLGSAGRDGNLMRTKTALRKYNGSTKNPKTRAYAEKVLQLAFSIAVEAGGTL